MQFRSDIALTITKLLKILDSLKVIYLRDRSFFTNIIELNLYIQRHYDPKTDEQKDT